MNNIGDFAESLILGEIKSIQEGKSVPPNAPNQGAPAGKDIRDIKVPNTMMKEILGESYTPSNDTVEEIPELVWADPNTPAQEEKLPSPTMITESTAQELVPLLEEVRNLLREMTAATTGSGNIGANFAGPQKDSGESWEQVEKSYGYRPTLPPTLPNNRLSRKNILKKSIRNRLRRSR